MIVESQTSSSPRPRGVLFFLALHVVSVMALLLVVGVFLPKYASLVADSGVMLPSMTVQLISLGRLVAAHLAWIAIVVLIADLLIVKYLYQHGGDLLFQYGSQCLSFAMTMAASLIAISLCLPMRA